MKKNLELLSENFQFLVVKFSVYLNRHIFIMSSSDTVLSAITVSIGTDRPWKRV